MEKDLRRHVPWSGGEENTTVYPFLEPLSVTDSDVDQIRYQRDLELVKHCHVFRPWKASHANSKNAAAGKGATWMRVADSCSHAVTVGTAWADKPLFGTKGVSVKACCDRFHKIVKVIQQQQQQLQNGTTAPDEASRRFDPKLYRMCVQLCSDYYGLVDVEDEVSSLDNSCSSSSCSGDPSTTVQESCVASLVDATDRFAKRQKVKQHSRMLKKQKLEHLFETRRLEAEEARRARYCRKMEERRARHRRRMEELAQKAKEANERRRRRMEELAEGAREWHRRQMEVLAELAQKIQSLAQLLSWRTGTT